MNKQEKFDMKIARRCLNFTGHRCDNKDCSVTMCPLNKEWD